MEEKFEDVLAEMFFEVVVEATHVHVVAAARRLRAAVNFINVICTNFLN